LWLLLLLLLLSGSVIRFSILVFNVFVRLFDVYLS